ncbi:MAG: hypothetical protein ACT4ON_03325 [Bacteroidota bacterium]
MIINSVIKKNVITATALVLLYGCGSENSDKLSDATDSIPAVETKAETKSQNVFYSIPSPIQLGQILQRAGATYNKKALNPLDNVSKYSTNTSKALNLGVYGADLSYSAIFNQTQETMSYLNGCKKLAEELGITGSFTAEVMKRMEKNGGNKDSLLQIISELFLNSNEALKENEQSNISILVLSGGFIEGLYVGTQVAKTVKDNAGIITRIAELKGSLNNLIALMSTETSDKTISDLVTDLKSIKEIYDEMPVTESKPTVKADSTKNTMTIGGSSRYSLTKEQADKITLKAESIRSKIINP